MSREAYECLYVLWWLVAVVVMAFVALAMGFPHSLDFLVGVGAWLAVWTGLGVLFDAYVDGKFSENAFPFGARFASSRREATLRVLVTSTSENVSRPRARLL